MEDYEKLKLWQDRLEDGLTEVGAERVKRDEWEQIAHGSRKMRPLFEAQKKDVLDGNVQDTECQHVWNIVAENIESMIDSNLPAPKVSARRKKDQELAKIIENMLRNELDRMPFEEINDLAERTVPIQGGVFYHVEWDGSAVSPFANGDLDVNVRHPKLVVPQPGVLTGVEDMDWVIIQVPQTKGSIKRRYGIDVDMELEQAPELKSDRADKAELEADMITQNIAYYKAGDGKIGLYSWVNDTVLEDLEDYQSKRKEVCSQCGADKPLDPDFDGVCKACGSEDYEWATMDVETVMVEVPMEALISMTDGKAVEETDIYMAQETDGDGMGRIYVQAEVPAYNPNVFPIVLQKNVSTYGQLLGDSDVDKIADQQNTMNHLCQKMNKKVMQAGNLVTLPNDTRVVSTSADGRIVRLKDASQKNLIDCINLVGDISTELSLQAVIYEQSRYILGITDSLQGRTDATATSAVAKEFSAAQAAGRLESKKIMKNAAYAKIFELMFKFKLAYCDNPVQVVRKNERGEDVYDFFDRTKFLERDDQGNWWWIDDFLFSTDVSSALANNRQAMWQEATTHLQAGAYGDPSNKETLILYWTKLDELHYPGAKSTKDFLVEQLAKEQQAAQMQMQQQQQQQQQQQALPAGAGQEQLTINN